MYRQESKDAVRIQKGSAQHFALGGWYLVQSWSLIASELVCSGLTEVEVMNAGIIVLIIVIVIAVWAAATYNGLIKGRNSVEEGFSTMDVYLKKRFDLIPNLVETVKGYAKHEKETLENVVAARSKITNAGSIEERAAGESQLSGALKTLFAVAEAYPDLKANANFLDLQKQLNQVEQDIANARKYYNAVVKSYNNKCEMVPSSIIARMFNFTRKPMFEIGDTAERENVSVKF